MSKPAHPNRVEFQVTGDYALFSDPVTRIGGEKCSYQVPTYEALKGILASVYWKPTLIWHIDAVRVMEPIQTEVKGIRPIKYHGGNDLAYYTYLKHVRYRVRAHFEWNDNRPELAADRDENKHHNIARRMIEKGGRRDIFLGTRECQGYVEPCDFDEEKKRSYYADRGEVDFGVMFHGFDYPDETGRDMLAVRFWRAKMVNGVIKFCAPQDCTMRKDVREMKAKAFGGKYGNFTGLDEASLREEGGDTAHGLDTETL